MPGRDRDEADGGAGPPPRRRSSSPARTPSFSKSRKGMITSWNPGAARLFGYDAEDIIGRPYRCSYRKAARRGAAGHGERALGLGVVNYETQRQRKDGNLVDVSVTVSPIKDGEGTVIGCSSITRDITERKRIQEERPTVLKMSSSQPSLMSSARR